MPAPSDTAVLACLARSADRDAAARILRDAQLEYVLCPTLEDLLATAGRGAGVLLVEEELLAGDGALLLNELLSAQPAWSDLPVVLLHRRGPAGAGRRGARGLKLVRSATLVERPITSASLVSVLRMALQSRRRQYEVRDLLANLRELNETLERRVEERTAELARSNKDLEEFAHVASHDLQEPLVVIRTYLDLLQRRCQDRLDSNANEFIRHASEGAEQMMKLIRALLEYSRAGGRGQARTAMDCEQALHRVLLNLQTRAQEAQAEVYSHGLPMVCADEVQVERLLQNLIANAIKFRREGVPPRVDISARPHKQGQWLFEVKDNGIGIDAAQSQRIFTIFQRLHTREAYEGTGIGLAICKKIVERHGGSIWVESTPGQGSTFRFTLPAVSGECSEP